MGTKVHSKSYLPGYQPTRDLNEDKNFSWTLFCEHKSVSRQLFDEFKPRAAGSCSGYNKDMLKRTMLEHEAIFRKQVCSRTKNGLDLMSIDVFPYLEDCTYLFHGRSSIILPIFFRKKNVSANS